jgi:hypothetical protein
LTLLFASRAGSALESPVPNGAEAPNQSEAPHGSEALNGADAWDDPNVSKPERDSSAHIAGYVQVDWVIHRQSSRDEIDATSGEPLNQDRFLLRRGRLSLDGQKGHAGARLEIDASSANALQVTPFEAYVSLNYPEQVRLADVAYWLSPPSERARSRSRPASSVTAVEPAFKAMASIGLRRMPFGFDAVESDLDRPWLERTVGSRAFFGQARDFGAGVDLTFRFLSVALAVTNGEPLTEDRHAGRDLTRSKDWMGRAGVSTWLARGVWLQTGVSWLTGTGLHLGSPATKDSLGWIDGDEDGLVDATELTPVPGAAATPSRTFPRLAMGADVRIGLAWLALGTCTLRAEITRAINLDRTIEPADPVATGRDLRELAAHVGVSQELGEHLGVAARYDIYDPDVDAAEQRALAVVPLDRAYRTLALAVTARIAPLRVMFEYDHRRNALGRDPSGAATTLQDDAFTLRAEMVLR